MATVSDVTVRLRALRGGYDRFAQRALTALLARSPARRGWHGYVAAGVGTIVATLAITPIHLAARADNLSMVYLVVVIWLAIAYGRGPAICASFLAFFAFDFFFIPPVFTVTVTDPAEWVSLSALLVTGLVIGQLTGELRRREQQAVDSQQRTTILYELAQEIAADLDQEQLLVTLTRRIVRVFASLGVSASALFLPDADGGPRPRAIAHAEDVPLSGHPTLDAPAWLEKANAAWVHARVTLLDYPVSTVASRTCFIPLMSRRRVVGIVSITGPATIVALVSTMPVYQAARHDASDVPAQVRPQAALFAAFCDQIALALDHAALQQDAIQVRALRESERLKDALLSSVTHDLRTPIAAIQAAATSMLQPDLSWNASEYVELATFISAGARRLGRLVDNLLALSRLEARMAPPNKVWYPIGDVISAALRQLRFAGQINDHSISTSLPDDLLEAPMDAPQIERVVLNLIENAVKYSPPGSVVSIEARATGSARVLEVRVRDEGVGIPLAEQDAIFDRFYRLRQALPWAELPPPQGSGLGLAICAGIVREHGGRIWVESQPGAGSTFVFTLPIPDDPDHDALVVPSSLEEAGA